MRDLDKMIEEALGEEESELLRQIESQPILIERAMGMFGAGLLWTARVMAVMQALLFFAGVWAAWHFFAATDAVTQLRWGLPAAVLMLTAVTIKMGIAPAIHHDRLMRELKRIELQIARAANRAG